MKENKNHVKYFNSLSSQFFHFGFKVIYRRAGVIASSHTVKPALFITFIGLSAAL